MQQKTVFEQDSSAMFFDTYILGLLISLHSKLLLGLIELSAFSRPNYSFFIDVLIERTST